MKRFDPVVLLLIACLLGLFAGQLFTTSTARAQSGNHNDGHAEFHDEYMNWRPPGSTRPCCSARKEHEDGRVTGDCRPVRAKQDQDGNWLAFVDGEWLEVPPAAVLPIKAKDGRSHYCGVEGVTYCFVPAEVRS